MSTEISSYYNAERATERGTKIIDSSGSMDKNSFLQILSAELSNLDPSGDIDSTQYISQMAQFTSLEQMNNLTKVMTTNSNYNLVGKGVTMNVNDANGNPYTGIINAVAQTTEGAKITVEIDNNGVNEYKEFDASDINMLIEIPNYTVPSINNLNNNISFLLASSLINKTVELNKQNDDKENIQGKIVGVEREDNNIKIKLQIEGNDEIQEFSYEDIIKVI